MAGVTYGLGTAQPFRHLPFGLALLFVTFVAQEAGQEVVDAGVAGVHGEGGERFAPGFGAVASRQETVRRAEELGP